MQDAEAVGGNDELGGWKVTCTMSWKGSSEKVKLTMRVSKVNRSLLGGQKGENIQGEQTVCVKAQGH